MSKITQFNLVEQLFGPEEDCAFDQPCTHGHRMGTHSVYCHHPKGIARKCYYRFSRDLADYEKNECGGYTPNPEWGTKR